MALFTYAMAFLKMIVMFLCLALAVGFYTLVERKVLSYIQIRKGPNKVGLLGLPQPLADAAKLFTKEFNKVTLSFKPVFLVSPVLAICLTFLLWGLFTSQSGPVLFKLGLLFFLAVSSVSVYVTLLSGWSSNSKYSLLGGMRAVAQTISYEISMSLILLGFLLLVKTFNLTDLMGGTFTCCAFMAPLLSFMWLTSCVAEANRAPFDLAEGESELVSGFNIEYGSGAFAFLFIAEYGSILFLCTLTSCILLAGAYGGLGFENLAKILALSYGMLWIRGSYPRIRYDSLMSLTWKVFLASSLLYLLLGLLLLWNMEDLKSS